jgi:hypothetical protein
MTAERVVEPDAEDVPEPDEEAGDDCETCGHAWAEHTEGKGDPLSRARRCRVMLAQQRCDCAGYR